MHEYSDYKLLSKLQRLIRTQPYSRRLLLSSLYKCNTYPIYAPASSKQDVMIEIYDTGKDISARYVGLGMCKNAWACPRCAPLKINEYRQRITAIIDHWRARGYVAYMVTFTIPHYRKQSATEVFDNLRAAYKLFTRDVISHWRRKTHCLGTIDATECKYSFHYGWHFHKHVLFFVPADYSQTFTSAEFEHSWRAKWQKLCTPLLHFESNQIGLHISKREILSGDYIAKEMAKLHSNRESNRRSVTPFTLLESDNPRDNELFLEYCEAIRNHSRIHIGRKLSKGVVVDVKKNMASETQTISTTVVATFTHEEFRYILRDEQETGIEHRANILRAAEEDYFNGVFFYCHQHALPFPHEPDGYYRSIQYFNGFAGQ